MACPWNSTPTAAATTSTPEAGGKVSKTQLTQVGRALKQLGIGHIPAYSPEARGRCERAFCTLQGRLPQELELAGVTTVEAANRFLREVDLGEHNARFCGPLPAEDPAAASVQVPEALWRDVLCVQEERRVGNENCVRWHARACRSRGRRCGRTWCARPSGCRLFRRVPLPCSKDRSAWPALRQTRPRPLRIWPREPRDAASPVALVDNAPRCPQPHRDHNSGQLMRYLLRRKQRARYLRPRRGPGFRPAAAARDHQPMVSFG